MTKTLLLFLFSDRPDTYVNAISYAYDHFPLGAIKLVYIKGARTGLSEREANATSNRIWARLEELDVEAEIYHRINERLLDRHLVPLVYENLKQGLGQLIGQNGGVANCIIDITAAAKAPSIDIFSVCLALGARSVYAFELVDKADPRNPNASLYHSLGESGYAYPCLSDSGPVRASQSALLRKRPLLWAIGAASFIVLAVSLVLVVVIGPTSLPLQTINIAAAVVGLITPVIALLQERQR